jgi:hypothetical protein
MHMAGETTTVWSDLQRTLKCQTFGNWAVASGDLDSSFNVVGVYPDRIEVTSAGIQGAPRKIARSEFERVARLWPKYRQGGVQRQSLRDTSKNSTYIITLLHWLDPE